MTCPFLPKLTILDESPRLLKARRRHAVTSGLFDCLSGSVFQAGRQLFVERFENRLDGLFCEGFHGLGYRIDGLLRI